MTNHKILLVDDDRDVLEMLLSIFQRAGYTNLRTAASGAEALRIWQEEQPSLIVLDVMMPGENGIDTAREIRRYDQSMKIIFLTSSAEFAVESYTVGAYFYQLKPIWQESFFRLLDSVIAECAKSGSMSLILRCKSGITRVELDKLEYCEVLGRALWLHLTDGTVLESGGGMDHLCEQLTEHDNFLRIHRSYLVNLDHIKSIVPKTITMDSLAELPVPRGKYAELKDLYLEYAFRRKQVFLT